MTSNPINPSLANMQEAFKCVNGALEDAGLGEPTHKRLSRADVTVDGDLDDVLVTFCRRLEWRHLCNRDEYVPSRALLTHTLDVDVTDANELPGPAGTEWSYADRDGGGKWQVEMRIHVTDLRWVDAGDGTHRRAIATFQVEADGE